MKKQPESTLKNWDEVNLALKSLANLTVAKRDLENQKTEQINALTARFDAISAPLLADISGLEEDITAYVLLHKDEFVESRTKDFSFGSISLRVSKSVKVISKAVCIKALKALGMTDFISVKEDPNKDMLKTLSDIELAKVACEFKVTDNISIEPYISELVPTPKEA